ncbi:thiol-disulfide oxidoreductase DCC family protein [Halorubellus litoreus]|uniref:Thiol-disulfide oxidoreductase DCC family protein n=1 Tax=Halorubellus litoreus TaxID=755308 RepID=A0ABD5VD15_9EURY
MTDVKEAREAIAAGHPVVLFDGVCNLCNRFVQFVLPRDADGRFRFASLQSSVGQALLSEYDLDPGQRETFVLIEDGAAYTKSEAALRVAANLDAPYRYAWPLRFVPSAVSDAVYDFVAARRYEWFGRKDRCMMPDADVSNAFLSDGPADGQRSVE